MGSTKMLKRYSNELFIIDLYQNILKNIWEVIFKQLPDVLISIGVIDTLVPSVAVVASVSNGVVATNVVSSTAKISNLICQYYNRSFIKFTL